MIYWTTRSIVPSMRFYKENLNGNFDKRVDAKYVASCFPYQRHQQLLQIPKDNSSPLSPTCSVGVLVPAGLAAFPEELIHCPRAWADSKYHNIYSYTLMPRGGHFAAFEEPQLLAEDIFQFVRKVEKCWACRCTEAGRTWSVLYWLIWSTWRIHALMLAKTNDDWCWHILNCD